MVRLSVSELIGLAMQRAEGMLFGPIEKKKWLTIGVAAWFAHINELQALGGTMHVVTQGFLSAIEDLERVAGLLQTHLTQILLALSGITLVLFGLYLVCR